MKFTLVTFVAALTLVRAGTVYPRGSQSLVLSNTGETCTLGSDGNLECTDGTTSGVDSFSVSRP